MTTASDRSTYLRGVEAAPPRTLVDVLERTVATHGGSPALDDGTDVLTYRELWREVRSFAARLAASGVARGDRVGVRVSSGTRRLYVAILGTLAAGAAYVPVDADDPDERARLVFGEAGVAAIVTDDGIEVLRGDARGDGAADAGTDARELRARPGVEDDAWIIFTSGSTGTPKGVAVTHRNAAAFVDAEARLFLVDAPLGPGDRVLAGLSVAFDASCEEMWLAWRHGACLVPAPRSLVRSGMDLGPWLVGRGITVVSTVPTLASLWPTDTLAQVRLLIFGGEGLPPELAARLVEPGREVWNTYGPTEATVVACGARMTGEGPVRIGHPLDGWDLVVVDSAGRPVDEGEVGELVIGGVGLARYLDPAKDAEKYAPLPSMGWERAYRSGDLVRLEADGLLFQGRADEQVKLGGRRIELGEIDAALQALPGVAGGACAVKRTATGHELLVGYLACHDPGGFDVDAARDRLVEALPASLVPRLVLVEDLPTRTSGKVDRAALPWPPPGRADDADGAAAELSGTQAWLAGHWGSVLGASVSGPDDDFFGLGGGSLAAAQLVALLRERFPRVTVGDLYAYPRLHAQAAMLDEHARDGAGDATAAARRVAPVPRRAQAIQTLVTALLLCFTAARWLVALLTGGEILRRIDGFGWLPGAPWWVLLLGWLLLLTPPGQMGLSVLVSRTLLRGVRPGTYPRGGSVHLRLWTAERFAETIGAASMAGAPWIVYYARALGAKIGRGVDLHTLPPVTGLLTLGGGCAVEPEVDLSGHWVDGDVLHVGRVRVAARATVGARSTLAPGSRVGRGAHVEAGSTVFGAVPPAQVWAGSPAHPVKGKWQGTWPTGRPPRGRAWLVVYAASAVALALLPVLAAVPSFLLFAGALAGRSGPLDALGPLLLAVPGATLVWLLTLALLTLVLVRLLGVGLVEGTHAVRSRVGWQVWATERLLDSARTLLFPLYASLATPWWLRALGARVGRDVEASTVLLVPAMTRIDDNAFLADDTLVASYELRDGWMRVARARVGKRAFLGNSGMTAPGRKVPRDGLVAVLSAAPPSSKAGSSWMGSPPTLLRRAKSDVDSARTYAPPLHLKVLRGVVEACRVVPVMVGVALGVVCAVALLLAWQAAPWAAILLGGPLFIVAGAVAAGITVLAKWTIVGRFRVVDHPLWSSFVWRNELADTFTETVAGPWFAWAATGTPALAVWLRAMGARIGRGVWCETYWLPESDLVSLGDGATVNRGCVLQTHLFHDRIMSMDGVSLGAGATMGPHGVILPAASIGDGTTVGPGSLVLRGDVVPAGTRWSGNPIAPWDEENEHA